MKAKKILAVLLTAAQLFGAAAFASADEPADNVVASGQCGPDVYWTLYDDGLLELTGTGPMYDCNYYNQPYYPYGEQIHAVRICEGVTTVGASAFHQFSEITRLYDLPSTLTSIGDEAFRYNYFDGTVRIPAAVSYIGREAFSMCTRVTEYVVDSSNPYFVSLDGCIYTKDYSEFVQYPCGRTGALSLHSNVKVIRSHACAGTWGKFTGNLNLPEGLEVLEDSAFWRCTGLTGGLVLPSTLQYIGEWAFMGCPFTGGLVIPAGVQFIGSLAFSECDGITEVLFEGAAPTVEESIFGTRSDSGFSVNCYQRYSSTFTSDENYNELACTWYGYPLFIYNDAPVSIDRNPEDRTVLPGETAVFSVTASGGYEPYRYQWQYRAGPNGTWTNVSAASGRTANYTLRAETRHDVYSYRCTVTDAAGQSVLSSTAILMVNDGKSTTPPDIDPDFGADFPVLDLTPEEEALWDLGELNEADLKVLAPVETSAVGPDLSASAETVTFTADFGDEASAFFGDLSVYDFDPATDTAEFDDTVSE